MNSDSSDHTNISGALSTLSIGNKNESNNKEEEAVTNVNSVATCANCGKEGDGDTMNACNKCDLVVYCNAACKKRHRHKHKEKCERRVAELYDKKLFREHPPREECPICFLPLPLEAGRATFESCCGKRICNGCNYAIDRKGADLCAFCRTPYAKSESEQVKRIKKLAEKGVAEAFNQIASWYAEGTMGVTQSWEKANELYLKTGELGCAEAYFNLGNSYLFGRGVVVDRKKANLYYELAAINGNVSARNNLGVMEDEAGNHQRAFKHYILAASAGFEKSLDAVKEGFMEGHVTKDDYANTLRAYQKRQNDVKSEMRDEAAAV